MIRIQLHDECPAPAIAGQEGDHIGILLNPYLFEMMPLPERVDMFNELMSELERMRGTVIDMHSLREKRQISLLATEVEQRIKKGRDRHGVDTHTR